MKMKIGFLTIGLFISLATVGRPASLPTITISLQANPATHDGTCPVTVNFKGSIQVDKACTVGYRAVRSDNWKGPVQTLRFAAAGSQSFASSISLNETFNGWMAVEAAASDSGALVPSRGGLSTGRDTFLSNKINLKITCASPAAPHITKVKVYCMGYPCNDFEMMGTGFGPAQGSRKVFIDGHAASQYSGWNNTGIAFFGPATVYNQTYHFGIYEGGNLISNDFAQQFPADIDGSNPIKGPPGTHITISSFGAGATQGTKTVKMGTASMQVLSWTGSPTSQKIVAIVPNLSPGQYPIDIYEAGNKISVTGFSFTVQ